jgi:hypothetical protein
MNNQVILRVCQYCYRIMTPEGERTHKVWNGVDTATHGICQVCEEAVERFTNDVYIDMTEKYRRR